MIAWFVLAVVLAACGGTYLWALAPGSGAAPPFGSDAAVPVLMCNDPRFDLFHLYYYGQDRFGAWPFWAASAAGKLLGFAWTPAALHVWLTLWLLAGVVPAVRLGGKRPVLGGLGWLAIVGFPGAVRYQLSDLAQPYAWQLPALVWAWWGLRRWAETPRPGRAAAAFVPALLAVWTSTLSLPLLVALAVLEAFRHEARPGWRGAGRALLPVLAAGTTELAMRIAYHRAGRRLYGDPFVTRIHLDWGHLEGNFVAVGRRLLAPDGWPWLSLAIAFAAVAIAAWRSSREDGERRDLSALTLGMALLSLLPIPVLVAVNHVRVNFFYDRYFTPTLGFARGAAWAGAALAAALVFRSERWRRRVEAVAVAMLAAALVAGLPRRSPDPDYARRSETARALLAKAPGSPLLDGYWGSYVLAALAPPRALVPIVTEGEQNRTPFDLPALRSARTVVVGSGGKLAAILKPRPPTWLWQYGVVLRLVEPELYASGPDTFALYRNATADGLPFEGPAAPLSLASGRPLAIRFRPVRQASLFVERRDRRALAPADLKVAAGAGVPVRVEPLPLGFRIELGPAPVPFSALQLDSAESVPLEGLYLAPG